MSCCNSSGPCLVCKIFAGLVALVLTITTVAAAIGAWNVYGSSVALGSSDMSFALLTLAVSATLWLKVCKKMCNCRCKSAACSCPPGQCNCAK